MTKHMLTSPMAKVKKIPIIVCPKNKYHCNVYGVDACTDCPIEGAVKHKYGQSY